MAVTSFLPWEDLRVVPRATGAESSSKVRLLGRSPFDGGPPGKHRCRTGLAGEPGIGSNE